MSSEGPESATRKIQIERPRITPLFGSNKKRRKRREGQEEKNLTTTTISSASSAATPIPSNETQIDVSTLPPSSKKRNLIEGEPGIRVASEEDLTGDVDKMEVVMSLLAEEIDYLARDDSETLEHLHIFDEFMAKNHYTAQYFIDLAWAMRKGKTDNGNNTFSFTYRANDISPGWVSKVLAISFRVPDNTDLETTTPEDGWNGLGKRLIPFVEATDNLSVGQYASVHESISMADATYLLTEKQDDLEIPMRPLQVLGINPIQVVGQDPSRPFSKTGINNKWEYVVYTPSQSEKELGKDYRQWSGFVYKYENQTRLVFLVSVHQFVRYISSWMEGGYATLSEERIQNKNDIWKFTHNPLRYDYFKKLLYDYMKNSKGVTKQFIDYANKLKANHNFVTLEYESKFSRHFFTGNLVNPMLPSPDGPTKAVVYCPFVYVLIRFMSSTYNWRSSKYDLIPYQSTRANDDYIGTLGYSYVGPVAVDNRTNQLWLFWDRRDFPSTLNNAKISGSQFARVFADQTNGNSGFHLPAEISQQDDPETIALIRLKKHPVFPHGGMIILPTDIFINEALSFHKRFADENRSYWNQATQILKADDLTLFTSFFLYQPLLKASYEAENERLVMLNDAKQKWLADNYWSASDDYLNSLKEENDAINVFVGIIKSIEERIEVANKNSSRLPQYNKKIDELRENFATTLDLINKRSDIHSKEYKDLLTRIDVLGARIQSLTDRITMVVADDKAVGELEAEIKEIKTGIGNRMQNITNLKQEAFEDSVEHARNAPAALVLQRESATLKENIAHLKKAYHNMLTIMYLSQYWQ